MVLKGADKKPAAAPMPPPAAAPGAAVAFVGTIGADRKTDADACPNANGGADEPVPRAATRVSDADSPDVGPDNEHSSY